MSQNEMLKTASTMMAIPYDDVIEKISEKSMINGEFSPMLFAELNIDNAIEKIKASKDFKFIGIKLNKENLRLISVEYQGDEHDVFLFYDNFNCEAFFNKTVLMKNELEQVEKSDAGLVAEIMFTNDINKSYLFQLKLLNTLFDDICAVVDLSANSLCSGKWLKHVVKSKVAPQTSFLYSIHATTGDEDDIWLHTHGLHRCGLYELEMLNLTRDNYNIALDVLSYLVANLLENGICEEYELIQVGQNVYVALQNSEEAILRYENIVGISDYDREDHNVNCMTVLTYDTEIAFETKALDDLTELLRDIENYGNPAYILSQNETIRMATVAKETFKSFLKLCDNLENSGIIKCGIAVDDEYQDESDVINKEHLWFDFIEYNESTKQIIGILRNKPYFIKDLNVEDKVSLSFDDTTDWIVYGGEVRYTPNNIYLYE